MTYPGAGSSSVDRRHPLLLHWLAVAALVGFLGVTIALALVTRAVVHDQNTRLLEERANEVELVFSAAISPLQTGLEALGTIAKYSPNLTLFTEQAEAEVKAGTGPLTVALLQREGNRWRVAAVAGTGLSRGQFVTGPAASTMLDAEQNHTMVATPVLGSGADRNLGFVLGGPDVPPGAVVYRESFLGTLKAPREANTAPFHEVRVVLYADPRPDPNQVLVTTTSSLPLHGSVVYLPVAAGASRWLLGVSAIHPLVGSVAAFAPWGVLIVGVLLSLLIAIILEQVIRRRDTAEALYRSERNLAETLQRRLLPTLPPLAGLDVASRYVVASYGQQVGGDWFDAFDLGEHRAAITIGDVVGHDIEAAAAMAQVRASLRAYGWEGGRPAAVLERLSGLVEAFNIAALVSAIYCVVDSPEPDGGRWLDWANAGHLPPLLRLPDGRVEELSEGSSPVVGAPANQPRQEARRLLPPGCTLVLYTDGLVEVPGTGLDDSVGRLKEAVAGLGSETPARDMCESILAAVAGATSRDDIAMVVVRIVADHVPAEGRLPEAVV